MSFREYRIVKRFAVSGRMAEWSKATDCKSVGESLRWFKSSSYHHSFAQNALTALLVAALAQQVEHIHGKDGVPGPSPGGGSTDSNGSRGLRPREFLCRQGERRTGMTEMRKAYGDDDADICRKNIQSGGSQQGIDWKSVGPWFFITAFRLLRGDEIATSRGITMPHFPVLHQPITTAHACLPPMFANRPPTAYGLPALTIAPPMEHTS